MPKVKSEREELPLAVPEESSWTDLLIFFLVLMILDRGRYEKTIAGNAAAAVC